MNGFLAKSFQIPVERMQEFRDYRERCLAGLAQLKRKLELEKSATE